MERGHLGGFEHIVLLAILRLDTDAYAPAILAEIERCSGRAASAGSMYVTLDRLEEKGLIRSRLGAADAARGGRPRRFVTVTARGLRELRATRSALLNLWTGLYHVLAR